MNRLRAILLYELQAVVAVRSRKLCMTREISKEELQAHVKVQRYSLFHICNRLQASIIVYLLTIFYRSYGKC